MIPAPMDHHHLALFLRDVAAEVERKGSFEGSIVWGEQDAGIWDEPIEGERGMYVMAMVRNGNQDGGQGGAWVVGQAEGP